MPSGTVHSGCTDPTQAIALFVIVLANRIIQMSGSGNNNLVKWTGTFQYPTDRNDQTGQCRPPSKVVSNI